MNKLVSNGQSDLQSVDRSDGQTNSLRASPTNELFVRKSRVSQTICCSLIARDQSSGNNVCMHEGILQNSVFAIPIEDRTLGEEVMMFSLCESQWKSSML